MATLESVSKLSDQKHKIEQYRILLNGILARGSSEECQDFADHSACLLDLSELSLESSLAQFYAACSSYSYTMKCAVLRLTSVHCSAFGQCASCCQPTAARGVYQCNQREAATGCAQGSCHIVSSCDFIVGFDSRLLDKREPVMLRICASLWSMSSIRP